LFWAAPIWWVPNPQRGYGGPLELLAGNAYFLAAVAFLLLAAVLLWSRHQDLLRPPGAGRELNGGTVRRTPPKALLQDSGPSPACAKARPTAPYHSRPMDFGMR